MAVPLTFNDVAKNIIKETISSAIFIDDHALEHFKAKNSKYKSDNNRTIKLFEDFKKNQCLLHSFKFTKKGWKENKRFYLKNKDLVILDWQLVKDDHSEALKILDYAVIEKSLHFICIYSQENPDAIGNEINRFFLGNTTEELILQIRETFQDTELNEFWTLPKTAPDWEEFDTIINSVLNSKKEDLETQIEEFRKRYDLTPEQIDIVLQIDQTNEKSSFSKLRTALTLEDLNFSKHSQFDFFKKSDFVENTFYIGHTIIKIIPKEITGDKLYESFLESFLREQNIFLSLMGLEMRNRFRENSAFIGKDFDDLSEDAFFYHKKKNGEHPYIFFDFLREVLKDQVASFMYNKNLTLFDAGILDEYHLSINGGKRLADFEIPANSARFINEVFKLNYFYNRIDFGQRKINDFLKFGDVFTAKINVKQKDQSFKLEDKYFICLTPHCDCLRAEKIKNQFWFVEGVKEVSEDSLLKNTDGKFVSFIKHNDKIIGVNWSNGKSYCQPFAMLVSDNVFTKTITADYFGVKMDFTFLDSIKENYTQRIANEAFGYPLRVGIDFVKKS